jgi:hypothetical protein
VAKRLPIIAISLLVAGILAFALNPSPEKHRRALKNAIAERSQINKLFGVGHLTAFASEYNSIGVLSYTTVDDELTSLGMFGMVYVVSN